MNRLFFSAVSLWLATTISTMNAEAQPKAAPDARPSVPTFSVADLEKYLGGRTTLSVDLKSATIEEVAVALSQASGQKIMVPSRGAMPTRVSFGADGKAAPAPAAPTAAPPAPLYNMAANNAPFWETLRRWQIEARDAAEKANALTGKEPLRFDSNVPNSLGVSKMWTQFELRPSIAMTAGRAVSAWPFLIVATGLKRTQQADLSQDGLREIEPKEDPLARVFAAKTGGAVLPVTPQKPIAKTPVPEVKRWNDRLALTAYVLPDPKLTPTGLRCEIEEATDERGNDLRLTDNAEERFQGSYQDMGGGAPMQILLVSRPDMGKRLVRLRGVMRFSVVTRTQHWETTDLKTPVEDTLHLEGGDFKVQFTGLTTSANGPTLGFKAESRGAHLERFWRNRINSRNTPGILDFQGVPQMRLIDEKGNALPVRMSTSSYGLGHTIPADKTTTSVSAPLDASPVPPDVTQNWIYHESVNFIYGSNFMAMMNGQSMPQQINIGLPAKLIVDFPVERREVAVPFEFTDLPLPPTAG